MDDSVLSVEAPEVMGVSDLAEADVPTLREMVVTSVIRDNVSVGGIEALPA